MAHGKKHEAERSAATVGYADRDLDTFDAEWHAPEYFNLWASHQYRDNGQGSRRIVVVSGPVAKVVRDTLVAIIDKNSGGIEGRTRQAIVAALSAMFECGHEETSEREEVARKLTTLATDLAALAQKLYE